MNPKIVCLCGSTRFSEAYQKANLEETLAGNIVLTIGCDMKADAHLFADKSPDELAQIKARLDELHLRKIRMSHEVLILNVGGYVGDSTKREIAFAREAGKHVRWLEPENAIIPAPKEAPLPVPKIKVKAGQITPSQRKVLEIINKPDYIIDSTFDGVQYDSAYYVEEKYWSNHGNLNIHTFRAIESRGWLKEVRRFESGSNHRRYERVIFVISDEGKAAVASV